jgi:transcriptional regulator with XRE-family HTH domain
VSDDDGDTTMLPVATGRPNAELARLVRSWRERLNPLEIPGLIPAGSHRRKSHVSQEDLARLVGVSNVWYGKLERGEPAHYSADFLDRVAIALRLTGDERMVLHLYALGREPVPRGRTSTVVVTESLRQVVDRQSWPTYLSDEAWDVIAYNRKAKEWFPWLGNESNVMRWVFTYPEARQQLHDWATDWAPPMLAQMRVANARDQGNERLTRLIQEILQSDDARRMWASEPAIYVHPDGDRRGIYLPYRQELITVEIVALAPLRAPNIRLMMLVPAGDRPPHPDS